jgi:DNA-binding transcriptional MerR regulator
MMSRKEPDVREPLLLIGEFAARSRLSPKALRLYAELGLLVPARVDPATGYRWYDPDQIDRARTVALLRHLRMPLARIAAVLEQPPAEAAEAVQAFWHEVEREVAAQAQVVAQLTQLLTGGPMIDPPAVTIRPVATRTLLSATRHVHLAQAGAVLGELLGQLRQAGPGLPGIDGCPFTVYYGAVSVDSDGPVEIVRPIADPVAAERAAAELRDVSVRDEPAHDEAFVRLTIAQSAQSAWPAQLPVLDSIEAHLRAIGRSPAGPPRMIMIADWRTAGPDDPAADLAVPLEPTAGIGGATAPAAAPAVVQAVVQA